MVKDALQYDFYFSVNLERFKPASIFSDLIVIRMVNIFLSIPMHFLFTGSSAQVHVIPTQELSQMKRWKMH